MKLNSMQTFAAFLSTTKLVDILKYGIEEVSSGVVPTFREVDHPEALRIFLAHPRVKEFTATILPLSASKHDYIEMDMINALDKSDKLMLQMIELTLENKGFDIGTNVSEQDVREWGEILVDTYRALSASRLHWSRSASQLFFGEENVH